MKSLLLAFIAFSLLCVPVAAATGLKIVPIRQESDSKVVSVNAATHEVTLNYKNSSYTTGKNNHTYTIDEFTTITINNVPGKFEDIHAGMIVRGTTERDSHTLDNLTLEGSVLSATPAK